MLEHFIMRILSILVLLFIAALFFFAGCANSNRKTRFVKDNLSEREDGIEIIHSHFDKMDQACPIQITDGVYVTSVSYSDDHKIVTYNYKFAAIYDDADIQAYKNLLLNDTRYMALYHYTLFDADDENNALNNAMINEGYSYCFCMFKEDGSDSGKYIDKAVTDAYDLASAKAFSQQHPQDAKKEILETIVRQYNSILPLKITEDLELLSARLFRNYGESDTLFLFRIRIPQGYTVLEVRGVLEDFLKAELEENQLFESSVTACRMPNVGIGFRVIKNDFSDSLLIDYPSYSLRETANILYEKRRRIYIRQ